MDQDKFVALHSFKAANENKPLLQILTRFQVTKNLIGFDTSQAWFMIKIGIIVLGKDFYLGDFYYEPLETITYCYTWAINASTTFH